MNDFCNYILIDIWPPSDAVISLAEDEYDKDVKPEPYFYVILGDKTTGDFEQEIVLRYGAGEYKMHIYNVTRLKAALHGDGDLYEIGGRSNVLYTIENTYPLAQPDDRTLFPSAHVQSESSEIITLSNDICSGISDPIAKLSAINEWVTTNLEYDEDSLLDGRRKKQDALSSFHNKIAVCEGYANLTAALARAQGIKIRYKSGRVRNSTTNRISELHAWVEAYVDKGEGDAWYLIDTTWNDDTPSNTDFFLQDGMYDFWHDYGVEIDTSRSAGSGNSGGYDYVKLRRRLIWN